MEPTSLYELRIIRELVNEENKEQKDGKQNIPEEYWTMRLTHKQLFKMYLKRKLNEVNAQEKLKESDEKCVL